MSNSAGTLPERRLPDSSAAGFSLAWASAPAHRCSAHHCEFHELAATLGAVAPVLSWFCHCEFHELAATFGVVAPVS